MGSIGLLRTQICLQILPSLGLDLYLPDLASSPMEKRRHIESP